MDFVDCITDTLFQKDSGVKLEQGSTEMEVDDHGDAEHDDGPQASGSGEQQGGSTGKLQCKWSKGCN